MNQKSRKTLRAFWLTVSMIFCFIAFQNCSKPQFDGPPETLDTKARSENNGHGYNGKLKFVKVADSGLCPDGLSRIEMEITVRLDQDPFPDAAFLERENCNSIAPKVLELGEEAILSSDLQSLTYQIESGAVQLVRDSSAALPATKASHLYVSPSGSDSNPGTQSQPFLTVQKAVDSASAGTTVHVAPGTYPEKLVIQKSGTEDSRLRVVSEVKWAAKIRPNQEVREIVAIQGDYVDLIGFEVDGAGSPNSRIGIGLSGSHVSAQNNYAHHIGNSAPCDNNGLTGILAYGSAFANIDEHIIGNTVHHVGTRQCRWHRAVQHSGTGSIINNVVSNAQGGIATWQDVHHVLIANNTVFNTEYGIYIGSGDFYLTPGPADYMKVINNIVVHSTQSGIMELASTVGAHNIFANNLAWSNGKDWELAPGRTNSHAINADPLFVSYLPDASGNYRLQSSSPAVNQGALSDAPARDSEGYLRGSTPDIGAFEWHP